MANSTDARRLFLQAVLSRRYMSAGLAHALWKKSNEIVQAADENLDVPELDWDQTVTQINESLNTLDLELSRIHDEETGAEMWALVNRRDDDVAQVASDLSPQEIAYFKGLVEEIILAPNNAYSVSSIAAIRDPPKPANMSKSAAESVLASFVARGWLLKSRKGRYSLAARSLLELQPYLKSTYTDDLLECTICLEILTKGLGCPTANCKVWMHTHCYTKYIRRGTKCPSCQEDWGPAGSEKLVHAGERAARPGDDTRSQNRRRSLTPDDDEAEDELVEKENTDDEAIEQTQPKKNGRRKSARRAASTPSQVDAMDEDEDEDEAPRRKSSRRRG